VRDSGQGISTDKQAVLFRRFEQIDNSLTRREGGTGLGLAICKQLIEMMNGQIGVESELGKGTTFWFELELDRAGPRTKRPATDVFESLAVQIVKPSSLYETYYDSLLAAWGIAYDTAADVATAIQQSEQSQAEHQVLLLDADVFNSSFNSKDLKNWREQDDKRTVIVTCPQSMLTVIPQAINDASDLIVSKPVVQSELFNALLAVVKDDLVAGDNKAVNTVTYSDFDAQVLVVEDNPINVAIVTGLLNKFGVDVSLAENGLQALTMLKQNPYDLVLMDCQMPELDGYEATRRIRQPGNVLDSTVPVVALTAHAMREDEQKCLDAGMNDYLTKPIDPYELNKTLAEWLPSECLKKVAS
jgi:CheY-like chemotaxis protein